MEIRTIREGDKAGWQRLWAGYRQFYKRPEQDQVAYDRDFSRLLNDDPHDFYGLVAVAGGQLIGLVHYLFHANMRLPEGVCYLQDLFTAPEARGTGVGRALIAAVSEMARTRGVHEVYWLTAEDNYAGRMLYDRVADRTPFIKYARTL